MVRLGKRMSIRQQALATAQIYLKRFYTKVPIRDTNPYLVLATCVYLACKIEECPQHIRVLAGEARTFWPEYITGEISKLAECEFHIISEMNSYLIVHHPYRTLQELTPLLGLTTDESSTAWCVINDSYLTDLPLLHAPHVIALTAIFLAVVLKPTQGQGLGASAAGTPPGQGGGQANANVAAVTQALGAGGNGVPGNGRINKLTEWYAESGVDIEALVDCTQEIISLYEVWDGFSEKACKEQLGRMIKQRGLC
jgi:cyclin-C